MTPLAEPEGRFEVRAAGEAYCISNYERMAPFLMNVVSDSDLWMFVSSSGGLTAGRVDEETSLFPYETDDRLHCAYGVSGPLTVLRVHGDGGVVVWRPFEPKRRDGRFQRTLFKGVLGNWVEFEEVDHQLGLVFAYRWSTSDRFGFFRSVSLRRVPGSLVDSVRVLDGFLNVMPAGVPLRSQQSASTLVDAYKRAELEQATGVGVFTLEAQITDRAEAAESLRANVVWARGLPAHRVVLSSEQLGRFLEAGTVRDEHLVVGRRGAYLVAFELDLRESEEAGWDLVADVGLDHVRVADLRALLVESADPGPLLAADVERGTAGLTAKIASADGLQQTGDRVASTHHAVNVLFNIMRGGVFDHTVRTDDFLAFVNARNRQVFEAYRAFFTGLPEEGNIETLLTAATTAGDANLRRLTYEYLPLFYGRRHGDPSRPWNRFSIRTKNEDGSRRLDYQGNWRDIFQNWEALALSFPGFLESMIAVLVNASTVDGHNPYRIGRDGIDWEIPEPDHPWSNIGYWGDHQIVYLLRLLEASERYHPGAVTRLLDQAIFSYADVPYRIAPYQQIIHDPKATIDFDRTAAAAIDRRVETVGSDGRLLTDRDGTVYHVNLSEKLLVPALAKLSNLVVDGGIWLNTQRPEWNDANNALVGNGLSMVTLSYLRRYLAFLLRLFETDHRTFSLSAEVAGWLQDLLETLHHHRPILDGRITDSQRRRLLDAVGTAFSTYRTGVYEHGFSDREELPSSTIVELCRTAVAYLDHSIHANRRDDGLYHSYNLLALAPDGARLERLSEMLEGQVAVLSAGILSPAQSLDLIDALYQSALHRPDQNSFLLYPARPLPSFWDKNLIPPDLIAANPLLQALLEAGDTSLVAEDASGRYRFHPDCVNAAALDATLDRLAVDPRWFDLVAAYRSHTHRTYEAVFHHHAFTGRSGSMYKYEGLGSVYWHMVAKLLVAVQETFFEAVDLGTDKTTIGRLADAYHRIRNGLGFTKTPAQFGAFPIDPYSHTPAHAGAQQPGMTGQVKEEIITRQGELGVRVLNGTIRFEPLLLQRHEFSTSPAPWRYLDAGGHPQHLTLPPGSLGFTLCGVPIISRLTNTAPTITITDPAGQAVTAPGTRLDQDASRRLFRRDGSIRRIEVEIPESTLMPEGS